jgi:hypothetical protein
MSKHLKLPHVINPGLATLFLLLAATTASAQIITSTVYDGSGRVNDPLEWNNGLPGKSPNGGLVAATDSDTSSWTGSPWTTLDIRHTGGFLFDAENLGLYLNQGAVYEVETDTDYSNVDLEISGTLDLWANAGTSSEVRIISGRVDAALLKLRTGGTPPTRSLIDMTNGELNVGALAANMVGDINFSATGSGTVSIGNMAGFTIGSLLVNFETGSQGSLYFGDNNGINTIGSVNFLVDNGKVSIGGVPVSDRSAYSIIQDGTATTLALVSGPEPVAPVIAIAVSPGTNPEVSFPTEADLTYQLQKSTDMSEASWADIVGQSVVGDGLPQVLSDPDGNPASGQKAFYRVVVN